MKTYIKKNLLLAILLTLIGNPIFAQTFGVSVEGGGFGNSYFKPIQSGKLFTFKIKVKNRDYVRTDSVRINKGGFVYKNFFKILDSIPKELEPNKTAVFNVKVSIPEYETDGYYTSRIDLDCKPKKKEGEEEQDWSTISTSDSYTILIDNTPPDIVEVYKKSCQMIKVKLLFQ